MMILNPMQIRRRRIKENMFNEKQKSFQRYQSERVGGKVALSHKFNQRNNDFETEERVSNIKQNPKRNLSRLE